MTTRQLKVSRLIQKEISQIFLKQASAMFGNILLTVTMVEISPDLSLAKVYVSVMIANDKQAIIDQLNQNTKALRMQLGAAIRHQLRIVPELIFILDDSAEYAIHINNVLNKLKS